MNGFVITHLGKRCKIGSDDSFATIICSLVIQRNEFILEGGNMSGSRIGSWQRIQEGWKLKLKLPSLMIRQTLYRKRIRLSKLILNIDKWHPILISDWIINWKCFGD